MRTGWLKIAVVVALVVMLGNGSVAMGGKKVDLPAATATALKKAFPGATIGEAELESLTPKLFEVKLTVKKTKMEVTVTPDGQIVEVETEITAKDLPAAVAKAFMVAAPRTAVYKIERIENRQVIKGGKLVKLAKPEILYELKGIGRGKLVEIEFTAAGKIVKTEEVKLQKRVKGRKKNHKKDDDDDDDDDDDKDDDDDDKD